MEDEGRWNCAWGCLLSIRLRMAPAAHAAISSQLSSPLAPSIPSKYLAEVRNSRGLGLFRLISRARLSLMFVSLLLVLLLLLNSSVFVDFAHYLLI